MTAVAEAPARTGRFQEIDITEIHESPTNPRKRFGDLEALAASIRAQGVIEPLVVRPHATKMHGYELVAGARRLRASKLAGLVDVPCLVRTLTDIQALELTISENLSRKDVHPLEEADGYAALMHADHAYTPEAVGVRVGRSTSYVYQRLKLLELIPDARQAFEQDELTAAHAIKLARLSREDQKRALPECFLPLFGEKGEKRNPQPVARLDRWIEDHTKVDVEDRATLQHYLPEFSQQLEAETEPVASLLALSDSNMPGHYLGDKDHGLIGRQSWKEVKFEKACPNTKRGAIVHGGRHRLLWVCAKKGCPKHWPIEKKAAAKKGSAKAKPAPAYDWKAENEKREKDRQRTAAAKPFVLAAIARKLSETKLTDALIVDLFERVDTGTADGDEFRAAALAGGMRLGVEHIGALIATWLAFDDVNVWDFKHLQTLANKHGVDLKGIEQQIAADKANEPAPPKAKAKTAKKGGKRS